jgi:hypothetical protein
MSKTNAMLAEPSRTPEREALASAIQRHADAKDRLAKIIAAQEHASEIGRRAFSAVKSSKVVLEEAQASETAHLTAIALGELSRDTPSPIKVASVALETAEADHAAAKKTEKGLADGAEKAERELTWASRHLEDSVKAVVKADPVVEQLIADYRVAQATYLDLCQTLTS